MQYKLKSEPEVVYYMETKECIIEDDKGIQHEIRFSEHSKGTDFFILEDGIWKEILDRELITWIIEDLPYEEIN